MNYKRGFIQHSRDGLNILSVMRGNKVITVSDAVLTEGELRAAGLALIKAETFVISNSPYVRHCEEEGAIDRGPLCDNDNMIGGTDD